jgi:hypothetical protein
MSRTLDIDVVSASYWYYMALMMAKFLSDNIPVPLGIYSDALRFFESVMQEVEGCSKNPPATLTNYIYASRVVVSVFLPNEQDIKKIHEKIREFSKFLKETEAKIIRRDKSEKRIELAKFFAGLAILGKE